MKLFCQRFLSNTFVKRVAVGFAIVLLVCGFALIPATAEVAQACSFQKTHAYAGWHNHNGTQKRAVYVYSPGSDKSVKIWFRTRWGQDFRIADSGGEIRQKSPTARSGGWQIHHIATRFKPILDTLGGWNSWDDDWRWTVYMCK